MICPFLFFDSGVCLPFKKAKEVNFENNRSQNTHNIKNELEQNLIIFLLKPLQKKETYIEYSIRSLLLNFRLSTKSDLFEKTLLLFFRIVRLNSTNKSNKLFISILFRQKFFEDFVQKKISFFLSTKQSLPIEKEE